MSYKIRPMKAEDLETVSQLYELANPFTTAEHIRKWTMQNLVSYPQLCFTALEGSEIVGATSGYILENGTTGILDDIAVHPSRWKRGIGSALLKKAIREFKRMGTEEIVAEVHYKCASALPFYYKYGFRMERVVLDRFGQGEDSVTIKLKLK
jgi:ribosomal protein S18 acetylase RimI-like enzyme